MFDLLTTDEDKLAASQGWGLHHVYDMNVSQWVIRVLPVAFQDPLPHAEAAGAYVVNLARQGQPVALKALRFLMHGVPKK